MDTTEEIKSLLGEHESIRHYMDEADGAVAEMEVLFRRQAADWTDTQKETLKQRQFDLQQAILSLKAGLGNHYAREGEFLLPLLGDILTKAVAKEQRVILKHFVAVNPQLANINLDESHAQDLLTESSRVRLAIHDLRRSVDEHSNKMDMLLQLLESANDE